MHDRAQDFPRRRLLARCLEACPRIVRLIALPGWGKSTFARQIAAAAGSSTTVECREVTSADDLDERLAAALGSDVDVVVVDSAEQLAAIEHAVARLRDHVERRDAGRRFVIASRVDLEVGAGRAVAPHEVITVGSVDLAFDPAEIREVFGGLGVSEATLEGVIARSNGWPIIVFLFARLAREGQLEAALADVTHPSLDDLFAYAKRETFVAWTADQRAGMAAAVAIPQPTPAEVEEAVGKGPRLALETFAARMGPVSLADGRFVVPELVAYAVRRGLPDDVQRARDAALRLAVASGARLRAAQIRLADGDPAGAVDELEALGPHTPGAAQSPVYSAVAAALPPQALFGSRNVLVSVLADRNTQANPVPLLAAVERFSRDLPTDSPPEVICGNRAAYGALLRMADRPREARAVLERALVLGDPSAERTALMQANLAAILAVAGEIGEAETLLARAGVPLEGPAKFPVERFEVEVARNQLRDDPGRRRAAFERNVAEARFAGPWALAHALRALAAGAWLEDDDAAAAAAMDERSRLVDQGVPLESRRVRSPRPQLDAPVERYNRSLCLWYLGAALLEDDADTARRFAQVALNGFAEIGAPFYDAIAALVAAAVPGDDAPALLARARADAAVLRSDAMVAAVEAIANARYDEAGILRAIARRIERARGIRTSSLRIELLAGRVLSGDEELAVRERELELLVALSLERRALSREALASRLWPELSPDEANAGLRTAVYRLRKQLRDPNAVVSTQSGYRLADTIPVDVLEAEQFVAGARRFGGLSDRERTRLTDLFALQSYGLPSVYGRWEWFEPHERRLTDLLHDAGIVLAEDDLRRGDTATAIGRAEALLRADALDEPANEIAIRAHIAAGRKSEALRRFRRYREALEREYGVPPSETLSALLETPSAAHG